MNREFTLLWLIFSSLNRPISPTSRLWTPSSQCRSDQLRTGVSRTFVLGVDRSRSGCRIGSSEAPALFISLSTLKPKCTSGAELIVFCRGTMVHDPLRISAHTNPIRYEYFIYYRKHNFVSRHAMFSSWIILVCSCLNTPIKCICTLLFSPLPVLSVFCIWLYYSIYSHYCSTWISSLQDSKFLHFNFFNSEFSIECIFSCKLV